MSPREVASRRAASARTVREPRRTIPRAVLLALAITVAVYAGVALTLLTSLGAEGTAASHLFILRAVAGSRNASVT